MILDRRTKCPECSGDDNYISGICHISPGVDDLYIQCVHCGHYLVRTNLQLFMHNSGSSLKEISQQILEKKEKQN